MKRVNVDINDHLMKMAMKKSGASTKKELVNKALIYYRDLLLKKNIAKTKEKHENQR